MSVQVDWQCSRRLVDCNKYMLDNEIECDVTFTLTEGNGDQHRLRAHKFVLISRSPVFFAMLSGPLAEKGQEVRITDINLDTFKHLLSYLYEDDVMLTTENVFHVLYAAKKYLITSLSKICIEYLRCVLSPDNVCTFLENSFLIEDDCELLKNCLDVVSRCSKVVFHSESFFSMSLNSLSRVLGVPTLTIREVEVFQSCVQWARRKCTEADLEQNAANHRLMLGDSIRYIHLPALSAAEFTQVVLPTGILSAEEENVIFRYLLGRERFLGESNESFPFPTNNRECIECKCSLSFAGFARHMTSCTTPLQGMPQRSRWHISMYTDRVIRLKEIGFLGRFKGSLSVIQNDIRKLEISCNAHVTELKLEEDGISLDAGLFTIATDPPFYYIGDYYAKATGSDVASTVCDQDQLSVLVKELSTMCFLSHIIFIPTEEMHFVEDYFGEE